MDLGRADARIEKLLEVRGMTGVGNAGYRYVLTDLGRDRAMQFMDICRYVGAAPVPIATGSTTSTRMRSSWRLGRAAA